MIISDKELTKPLKSKIRRRDKKWMSVFQIWQELWLSKNLVDRYLVKYKTNKKYFWKKKCSKCWQWKEETRENFNYSWRIQEDWTRSFRRECIECKSKRTSLKRKNKHFDIIKYDILRSYKKKVERIIFWNTRRSKQTPEEKIAFNKRSAERRKLKRDKQRLLLIQQKRNGNSN